VREAREIADSLADRADDNTAASLTEPTDSTAAAASDD
jgi:hypothetical protein